jgi:hypothetical protein
MAARRVEEGVFDPTLLQAKAPANNRAPALPIRIRNAQDAHVAQHALFAGGVDEEMAKAPPAANQEVLDNLSTNAHDADSEASELAASDEESADDSSSLHSVPEDDFLLVHNDDDDESMVSDEDEEVVESVVSEEDEEDENEEDDDAAMPHLPNITDTAANFARLPSPPRMEEAALAGKDAPLGLPFGQHEHVQQDMYDPEPAPLTTEALMMHNARQFDVGNGFPLEDEVAAVPADFYQPPPGR